MKHKQMSRTTTSLKNFKELCNKHNINFSSAYDYKRNHPELSEEQVIQRFLTKLDFKDIKNKCKEQEISYINFMSWYRKHKYEYKKQNISEIIQIYKEISCKMNNKEQTKVGLKQKNTYGLQMELVTYRNANDVDIKFLCDNTIVKHKLFSNFIKGSIGHPKYNREYFESKQREQKEVEKQENEQQGYVVVINVKESREQRRKEENQKHIGERNIASNGMAIEIIDYREYNDIDIRFEDETIVRGKSYQNFKRGQIAYPKEQIVGKVYRANNGLDMKILSCDTVRKVTIQFEDGEVVKDKQKQAILKGQVEHPTLKIQTIGSLGTFKTKKAIAFQGEVYYRCICTKCNLDTILTPQEMLQHKCSVMEA